ncbi:DUF262 domain-containing protein [Aeromonas sanarellii]|uniref:DUF262 domain-containing protein n=1 Tax=Aeromonas sanarellii TaxID=633415 RepID=UPI003BA1B51A
MVMIRRESNSVTLATVWENQELKKYDLEPPYQRNSVWSEEKQSFLIDSIIKNIPIPPIFLHQKIDDATGKTVYAVIDGKQRLESIFKFIKGEIPSSSEDETSPLYEEKTSGIWFSDLAKDEFSEIRKQFWRYSIPIEYVDTTDKNIIDAIFDRLNRNGEPLSGQELRRSQFYSQPILTTIENLSELAFWKERLSHVDVKRMEDIEFISELVFNLLEADHFSSDQNTLDSLYGRYSKTNVDWTHIKETFESTTEFMSSLNLNYTDLKINGVSHLYAIWCFSRYCLENELTAAKVGTQLNSFYERLRAAPDEDDRLIIYKKSMSSATKMRSQRTRRVDSLIGYVITP